MFSFKKRTYPGVISKDHIQDFLAKETPGAGTYQPKLLDAGRRWTISWDEWFWRFKGPNDNAPHCFELKSTLMNVGSDIPKDDWFHYDMKTRNMAQRSPGPGTYEAKTSFTKLG